MIKPIYILFSQLEGAQQGEMLMEHDKVYCYE